MLKLVEYLNSKNISMEISPSQLRHILPNVVDVTFTIDKYRTRFLVDIDDVNASRRSLEEVLLQRACYFYISYERKESAAS